ncbi:MAG: hypothetical protein SNJ77_11065 [Cytophagales bacterium]
MKNTSEYSGFFDTYYFKGPWNFALGGGLAWYSGDLGVGTGNVFGANASYKFWPRTYFGGQLNYISLKGTDQIKARGISFNSTIYEAYGFVRFNILDKKMLKHGQIGQKEMRVRPYLLTGLGIGQLNSKSTTDSLRWTKDSIPEKGPNPRLLPVIPLALGASIFITHRVSVLLEFNYRVPFSDYIDDVKARGNSKKDAYYTFDLKLQISPTAPRMKKKMKFNSNPEPGPPPAPRPPKPAKEEKSEEEEPVEEEKPPVEEEKPKQEEDDPWYNPKNY